MMKDSLPTSFGACLPFLKIALAFLLVAVLEVIGHWFLLRSSGLSQSLLQFYLSFDSKVGKGISGLFDLLLPCVCLGFVIGWICWPWSVQRIAFLSGLTAAGMVALLPIYVFILHSQPVWWWPKTSAELPVFFLKNCVKATLLIGFFAYLGRRFGIHFKTGQI